LNTGTADVATLADVLEDVVENVVEDVVEDIDVNRGGDCDTVVAGDPTADVPV